MADSDCVFCLILDGKAPGTFVESDEHAVAFMDINPATRGHLLVVPREHAADLLTVDPADLTACALLTQRMAHRVTDTLEADGVNIIQSSRPAAWQTVFHLHFHVVPRYHDDPLTLPWRPTPGDPDTIADTAARLRAAPDGQDAPGRSAPGQTAS